MLARFSVIPRQLRQSNSPNIIQSSFTCDASSSIYCCNWDVLYVHSGYRQAGSQSPREHVSVPGIDPPFLLPSPSFRRQPLACRSQKRLRFQTVASITNPNARRRLPGRGAQKPLILTHGLPNCILQWTCDPVNSLQQNDMRDPPLPFSCSFSNSNSNSTSSPLCYSKA